MSKGVLHKHILPTVYTKTFMGTTLQSNLPIKLACIPQAQRQQVSQF